METWREGEILKKKVVDCYEKPCDTLMEYLGPGTTSSYFNGVIISTTYSYHRKNQASYTWSRNWWTTTGTFRKPIEEMNNRKLRI
jgi:hypothetical protein